MKVIGVHPDHMMDVWPAVAEYFKSFEERSNTTAGDLLRAVLAGEKQCWVVVDGKVHACALTSVQRGRKTTVELAHCAGEGREGWQSDLVEEIRRWAREIGADQLRTYNRPGWSRFLREMGLRETHRVMEQDIV